MWPHACSFFWLTFTAQKSSAIFRFGRKSQAKRWLRDLPSEGLLLPARRAPSLSTAYFSWRWNAVSCDRCRTSDTFSPARQALHFLHVAQTLAGVGPNERRFRSAVFGELGRLLTGLRVSFCEMVVVIDLALVHGLARQAHYFERFGSLFVASAVLQRPRQKTEVEAWLNLVFHFQCSFFVAHAVFGENETCAVQALYRDLAQGLLVESLHRDLEIVLYRDLVKRSFTATLPKDLV